MNSVKVREIFTGLLPLFGEIHILAIVAMLLLTPQLWLALAAVAVLFICTVFVHISGGDRESGLWVANATVVASVLVGGVTPSILVLALLGMFSSTPNIGSDLIKLVLRPLAGGATWAYIGSAVAVAYTLALYCELTCRGITNIYPGRFYDAVPWGGRPKRKIKRRNMSAFSSRKTKSGQVPARPVDKSLQ